ncbi:lipoate regulatory protein [Burkholderia pseudomallei]|uniref:HP0495 family protein n=1 Tax=Burkholderia pseudomallei TaxID=28450 RepID=UPI000F05924B|nr:YbeD family protein [Burkholderia pseudomallei]MBF3441132.1 YbeD family protein [Burkholderia pseudomallei]MBF3464954.1 YbeD family protein [Burkholderia pseudomallei]MBF3827075.1 YbeD family protein [Burkholderia pseudomallei]CAJ3071896.1 lipoate regulatory protein [Burkholderia pseudomallei]CAJ3482828.1 lipoate regulatory protein [Burkholderia pseudomallei]
MTEPNKTVELTGEIATPKETLLEFPCDFPIKVMGRAHPEFKDTIFKVVSVHDNEIDLEKFEERASSGGNYTGLTITVRATSQAQLDNIYRALTGHPMVKVVL